MPTKRQLEYLTSQDRQREQAGLSLDDRVNLFNSRFKTKCMSRRILRRLYAENQVKVKRIKVGKVWKSRDTERIKEEFTQRNQELARVTQENYDIVYLDEVVFSRKTYLDRTWSLRR